MSNQRAREVVNFTEERARSAKPPNRGRRTMYDARDEGLYLIVTATGSCSWYLFRRAKGCGQFEKLRLNSLANLWCWTPATSPRGTTQSSATGRTRPRTFDGSATSGGQGLSQRPSSGTSHSRAVEGRQFAGLKE